MNNVVFHTELCSGAELGSGSRGTDPQQGVAECRPPSPDLRDLYKFGEFYRERAVVTESPCSLSLENNFVNNSFRS